MAGKPRPMSQIKQLLRLHQDGAPIKSIARTLNISKNTVKTYLAKLSAGELDIQGLLSLEDPVLETEFHAGNPAYKDARYIHLTQNLDYLSKELGRIGVTKKLLWEEYILGYSAGYCYSHFCHHLHQLQESKRSTCVLHHEPGDKLFIDFAGKKMFYTDVQTGEIIWCQIFLACLPFSDYAFAVAVRSQCMSDFLYALGLCLAFIGGVPKALVPDNLKSAVTKSDRYEPDISRCLEDFANHYKTTVVPARVRKPRDKGLVENQVKMAYTRVYAKLRNHQFFDLASLNQAITEKICEHNQTRMQLKGYCRQEHFLSAERMHLAPLPKHCFEIKYYTEPKVALNGHVFICKHHYSVPFANIGKKVKAVYTRNLVHIYWQGNQIATHVRNYKQGGYSSLKEHLSSHNNFYLQRSPGYYIQRAGEKSAGLQALIKLLFEQKKHPEQLYRTCDGLLKLQRITRPDKFEKACQMALLNENYSYRFLQNILANNMTEDQPSNEENLPLPVHTNIRGKAYYIETPPII